MPTRPKTYRSAAQQTKAERDRASDARRGSARARGYTTAWDKAAAGHLRNDPLCRYCALIGDIEPATLVDHLYPHKQDQWLFWLKAYWVSSCDPCHNGFKQRVERRGRAALDALAVRLGLQPLWGGGSKVQNL